MNPKRVADLTVLLEENPISYYWMGFLMADGHFYKRGAIKLHLAEKDVSHVNKFGEYIKYTGKAKPNTINVMNPPVVWQICDKFKISNKKTIEPCDLTGIKDDNLLLSLFVGFFDGDGSIYKNKKNKIRSAAIKVHSSWLPNLSIFENFLYCYFKKHRKYATNLARLNNRGYALLILSDLSLLAAIKKKSLEFKLPIMKRKWDYVDERVEFNSHEKSEKRFDDILRMLNFGKSNKEISEVLGIGENSVYMYLRRNNLCQKFG